METKTAEQLAALPGLTKSKLLAAIGECDRYIALESPRSADLRPAHAAQHFAFCVQHKATLLTALTMVTA